MRSIVLIEKSRNRGRSITGERWQQQRPRPDVSIDARGGNQTLKPRLKLAMKSVVSHERSQQRQ